MTMPQRLLDDPRMRRRGLAADVSGFLVPILERAMAGSRDLGVEPPPHLIDDCQSWAERLQAANRQEAR